LCPHWDSNPDLADFKSTNTGSPGCAGVRRTMPYLRKRFVSVRLSSWVTRMSCDSVVTLTGSAHLFG